MNMADAFSVNVQELKNRVRQQPTVLLSKDSRLFCAAASIS